MKSILLAGAALFAMTAASAAADLRGPAPMYAPAAAPMLVQYSWTGFYVGVTAGVIANHGEFESRDGDASYIYAGDTVKSHGVGGVFGATLGYNWQFGSGVIGVEADYSMASTEGKSTFYEYYVVAESNLKSIGTVRARLGFAMDRALVYATGGIAYARVENTLCDDECGYYGYSNTTTRSGWVAGVGLEYAFAPNWTIKAEGLYYDLGGKVQNDTVGESYLYHDQSSGIIGRVGLNFKFGGGAVGVSGPVVAAY